MTKNPATALGLLVLAAVLVTAACGDDAEDVADGPDEEDTQFSSISLEADDFYFEPAELTAEPGQKVTISLRNEGQAEHTFTIDKLEVDEVIGPGEEKVVSLTPSGTGELQFYCRYHQSQMTGTIAVGEDSAADSTKDSGDSDYIY